MPQIGWLTQSRSKVPFDEALSLAEADGEWEGMPYEVLLGIRKQVTSERPDAISVTQTLSCPRKVFLQGTEDYYVSPADNFAVFRGTIVHTMLEDNKTDDGMTEERFERDHRGIIISGSPDSVRVISRGRRGERFLIRDWKSAKSLPKWDNAYTNHQQQANLYRWLLYLDPQQTDLEIVYVSMEGVRIIRLKPSQVWSDDEVEAFLDRRLMPLQAQREQGRPVAYYSVEEDDLWQCDYCPVRQMCYRKAALEVLDGLQTEPDAVQRVVPRRKKK